MWISTFCYFYNQKRECDAILYHDMRMMLFSNGAFHISNSRILNHMQSCAIHKNHIIFSFLIIKVTKCWNLNVDTLNSNKYRYLAKLQHISSLMERLRQISHTIISRVKRWKTVTVTLNFRIVDSPPLV